MVEGRFRPYKRKDMHDLAAMAVPCGRCVGCRVARSRAWAARCMHEASLHERNSFVTVTYSPESLPDDMSLSMREHQLFMKRLREAVSRKYGTEFRFYMCGEYGELRKRPHYHYLFFGFDFPDKRFWYSKHGVRLYTSEFLESVWPFGYCSIGDVTYESAAYVSRYVMKKMTGDKADETYFDPVTGVFRLAEFNRMSLRPGLAKDWFEQYSTDVFPRDGVFHDGRFFAVPRYYNKLFEAKFPEDYAVIKDKRVTKAKLNKVDNTPERLKDRETVMEAQLQRLKRSLV